MLPTVLGPDSRPLTARVSSQCSYFPCEREHETILLEIQPPTGATQTLSHRLLCQATRQYNKYYLSIDVPLTLPGTMTSTYLQDLLMILKRTNSRALGFFQLGTSSLIGKLTGDTGQLHGPLKKRAVQGILTKKKPKINFKNKKKHEKSENSFQSCPNLMSFAFNRVGRV